MTEEEKDSAFCEDCQRCYEDEIEELEEKIRQLNLIINNNEFYHIGYKRGQYDEKQKQGV